MKNSLTNGIATSGLKAMVCLYLMTLQIPALCQSYQSPKIIPPSADVAEIGKYGIYPTDLSSGLPNISIPLYVVESRQLKVPISLSYHASGIRVNDVASWVGLGWVLNAGGALTRSVKGLPDENGGFASSAYAFKTQDQLNSETDKNVLYSYLDSRATGVTDNESDMYSYNANGLSGNFFYNSNHQITQSNLSNNKIIVTSPGISYTIVSEDGTSYFFDVLENTGNAGTTYRANTGFYLSRIESADKTDVVYFDYADDNTLYSDVYPSAQVRYTGQPATSTFTNSLTYIYTYNTKMLSKIRFSSGYVDFIRMADRQDRRKNRLSDIKVFTTNNTLIRTIHLNQSYFISTTPHTQQTDPNANIAYRLKLTGVDLQDAASTPVQSYLFTYNTSAVLPSYWGGGVTSLNPNPNLYNGQDIYGYFNGVTSNTHLLSIIPATTSYQVANRNVFLTFTQAAILTEIKYPTSGKTKFTYESNTTSDQTTGVIGGLRIKAIDNYTSDDAVPAERKTFTYSGGMFGSSPWYKDYFNISVYDQISSANGINTAIKYYSNSPTLPLSSGSNNGVFYNNITETNLSTTGVPLGKTDYEYEYEDDWLYTSTVTLPSNPIISPKYSLGFGTSSTYIADMGWARGPLKKQMIYKTNTDNSLTLIKSTENTYTKYNEQINYVGSNVFQSIIYTPTTPSPLDITAVKQRYQFFDIKIKNGVKKLSSRSETTDGLSQVTNYFYDNPENLYVTRTEKINSKNETIKVINRYPQDKLLITGLTTSATSAIDMMVTRNILTNAIENLTYNNTKLLSSSRTDFKLVVSGSNTLIVPDIMKSSTLSNPLEAKMSFNQFDGYGNVVEQQKANDIKEVYLWGYNSKYPVAKISNTTYNIAKTYITQSVLDAPADDVTLRTHLNALRAIPNAFVTTYTYKPLVGMTSATDPNGKTTYYEYDSFNRLSLILDQDKNILKKICYNYAGQPGNCE